MNDKIRKALSGIKLPGGNSHKGQNGRLLIIGGSRLFHSASLWSLEVASKFVDLVHYASVPENNRIVTKMKENFRNGIVVARKDIEDYINEDDCILIGPGMVRTDKILNFKSAVFNLEKILRIKDEGVLTFYLTNYLLKKYPHKKWVIDAGALQMVELENIRETSIITPHRKEWEILSGKSGIPGIEKKSFRGQLELFTMKYSPTVLLKGKEDYIAKAGKIEKVTGGNAGMTKGGTGDVLAGLLAGLYANNDPFLSCLVSSYINKKAGDNLFKKQGYFFNASDLASEIPQVMKKALHL